MTSPELQAAKMSARRFCREYNNMADPRDDTLNNARKWRGESLKEILGKVVGDQPITMEPPVFFSYSCRNRSPVLDQLKVRSFDVYEN